MWRSLNLSPHYFPSSLTLSFLICPSILPQLSLFFTSLFCLFFSVFFLSFVFLVTVLFHFLPNLCVYSRYFRFPSSFFPLSSILLLTIFASSSLFSCYSSLPPSYFFFLFPFPVFFVLFVSPPSTLLLPILTPSFYPFHSIPLHHSLCTVLSIFLPVPPPLL